MFDFKIFPFFRVINILSIGERSFTVKHYTCG